VDFLFEEDAFKKKYERKERLGGGCFGRVFKVTKRRFGKEMETLALKIVHIKEERSISNSLNEIIKNIKIRQQSEQCGFRHVVTFYSHDDYVDCSNNRYLFIEMEICDGGTLYKSNHYEGKYDNNEFRERVVCEAISGLHFIHGCNLAHWDIKGDNIFFKSPTDQTIKYGDFGLAKQYSKSSQALDVVDLGRTLLKHVFLRKQKEMDDFFDEESWKHINQLLSKKNVPETMGGVLVGLASGCMKLAEAERKMKNTDGKHSKVLFW
jgi:serine/threonine protein kinase